MAAPPPAGVTLTDTLPASVTFQEADPSQGSCSQAARTVICDLGIIAAMGSATVTIEVIPNQEGQITNTATVSGNESDTAPDNNDATEVTTVGGDVLGSPLAIPTLGEIGLALLGLLTALAGLLMLRRF